MPVCEVCSGTDFICESGFYFCSECQTQSQDVREELNDSEDRNEEAKPKGGKRRRSNLPPDTPTIPVENMTSWEGYNYALVGLVDELISLGVDPSFKLTMLKLWSSYLAKLEVAFVSKTEAVLPKLGPNFKHSDAQIIYGYSVKKTNAKGKGKDEGCEVDDSFNHLGEVERKVAQKRNRQAFASDYAKTLHEMSIASQSLTDVTLEMLSASTKGDEEEEEEKAELQELQFTSVAENFLNQKSGPKSYHPGLLNLNKLVSLIYLGLTASYQKLNLSDVLRWISEGHVSMNCLSKFFPPGTNVAGDTYVLFSRRFVVPAYELVLTTSQHLGSYIGMNNVRTPKLKDLIERYIKELNLPTQIGFLASRLLELLPQHHSVKVCTQYSDSLPNWEGRAMAHIIIALKLLFGLDDETEHRNSRVATRINKLIASQNESTKLFVWDDWVQFCTLRRTAFMLFHSRYYADSNISTFSIQNAEHSLSDWSQSDRASFPKKLTRQSLLMETHKRILGKFTRQFGENDNMKLDFPPSLYPNSDYIKIITRACREGNVKMDSSDWSLAVSGLNLEKLNESFTDTKVDYLTHPKSYVEWAQQHGLRIGLRNGTAASNIKVPTPTPSIKKGETVSLGLHRVKAYLDEVEGLPPPSVGQSSEQFQAVIRSFKATRTIMLPTTVTKLKKAPLPVVKEMQTAKFPMSKNGKLKRDKPAPILTDAPKEDEDNMLHYPCTEYWMLHWNVPQYTCPNSILANKAWQLPESFLALLEECALLLEMTPAVLLKEVTDLEVLHKDLSGVVHQKANTLSQVDVTTGKDHCLAKLKCFW